MIKERNHRHLLTYTLLLAAALTPTACSDDDKFDLGDAVQTVDAQLTFALPQRIVGSLPTRMSADVVQYEGTSATFRGLDGIHLLYFDHEPGLQSRSRGEIAYLSNTQGRPIDLATDNDYSVACQVKIPVGTTHFAFYAHAIDGSDTPADRFRYGAIETKGLDSYSGNSGVSFAPVVICDSESPQGGSAAGQALVSLLNAVMNVDGPEAAPDDRLSTAADERLREVYRGMSELKTLSSANVERILGSVYRMVNTVPSDYPGYALAQTIATAIAGACATTPDAVNGTLRLKDEYQGFPADLYLPEGAARIEWDAAAQLFVTPAAQVYGKGLDIPSMSDYVFPANLQYLVMSPLVASDSLALPGNETTAQTGTSGGSTLYANWQALIGDAYADGYTTVRETTQSVAMVRQVQYAVGRLDTRVITESSTLYDAYGKAIDCSAGFTLKGILIGGQHEVGYDFEPLDATHEYVLYDTDIYGGPQHVGHSTWTLWNHTLGLATPADQNELVALELVNDGPDFQGADGRIAHGATFYLVANMQPTTAGNYQKGSLDRIFQRDYVTKASLQVLTGQRDVNGDGTPDTDRNHDNIPDVYTFNPVTGLPTGIDENGDGIPDDYDIDGDGTADHIVTVDTDLDGTPDTAGWDTNGDGYPDIPILCDADGNWPDTPTEPSGLGTATYGIPTLTDKSEIRTFGLSVDLRWGRGMVFNDIEL